MLRRILFLFTVPCAAVIAFSTAAVAAVTPGTYAPTADSFNSANAPGSSFLKSGSPACTVNADRSIDCSSYVLGGVGHTNATVNLTGNYSATIDCTNHGGQLVESYTSTFSASSSATAAPAKNGQLSADVVSRVRDRKIQVPARGLRAESAPRAWSRW